MSNRYNTYQVTALYSLDQAIKTLAPEERIVKIIHEPGFVNPGSQYVQPFKSPDLYLLVTEVEDTDGKF